MRALQGADSRSPLDSNGIKVYGWIDASISLTTSQNSNFSLTCQVVPNRPVLEQTICRFERVLDSEQPDHIDWGFRLTRRYGIDYPYTITKGIFNGQLTQHNRLYSNDLLESYTELYVPCVMDGMVVRVDRYISPPNIEPQLPPDDYLAFHSLLYVYDAYTHMSVLTTIKLDLQRHVHVAGPSSDGMAGMSPTIARASRLLARHTVG